MTIKELEAWARQFARIGHFATSDEDAQTVLDLIADWREMHAYIVTTAAIGSVITAPAAQRTLAALKCKEE